MKTKKKCRRQKKKNTKEYFKDSLAKKHGSDNGKKEK